MRSSLPFLRQLHLYLGVFCAPAILFFAFTGAMQSFGLNDSSPGYKPPHWVSVLAQIHKKQSADLPPRRPFPEPGLKPAKADPSAAPAPKLPAEGPQSQQHSSLPERIFFLVVCVSLALSTFTGLWMSWKYRRSKVVLCTLFIAGIVVPLVLLEI